MLTQVKDHVPGCGGIVSQILAVRNDGSWDLLNSQELEHFARFALNYDLNSRQLLLAAADDIDDAQFEDL